MVLGVLKLGVRLERFEEAVVLCLPHRPHHLGTHRVLAFSRTL